ncbi:armadillo-type protein [Lipomyces tetrasporus]|uniref:Condensin complex subunit 1 n=1 Tax=Lipomyces tetrasporus TaxID=54092 RepID=A0AAD7QRH7_9ASCO|nr:armadillo-type protein [Lipomyces tetrasporus]KAJ8099886.1 armadillo-type protein [Lipomyces tetrasporus]
MDEFCLSDYLTAYLSDPSSLTSADYIEDHDDALDALINTVTVDSAALAEENNFETLESMLLNFPKLSPMCKAKLSDLIISGLSAQVETAQQLIESDEHELFSQQRQLLEMYSFLVQWTVAALENGNAQNGQGGSRSRSKSKPIGESNFDNKTAHDYLQSALEVMCKAQKLKLSKLFVTTSDRDLFISLYTRSAYLILENEQNVKNVTLKMHAFKVLCIAIKHNGHGFGAQTSLLQNLTYYDHLSETIAEFLQILYEQYDYPQLADEILRELSNKEFNSNDSKGPKSVSAFLVRFAEVAPRLVMQKMTLLAKHLDSDSYTLRCAIIEVCGYLILDLSRQEETLETHKTQINSFFDVLEERILDANPYCRSKAIQVITKLCDAETKFTQRRQQLTDLVTQSLEDKSSNVRRNAIKLLSRLISTHPFSLLHGGQLPQKEWKERLEKINAELNTLLPPLEPTANEAHDPGDLSTIDENLLDSPTEDENADTAANVTAIAEQYANSEAINRLRLTKQYYTEALTFINSLHKASEIICSLLSAKNKSEVIEAMDFFVIADAYKLETAKMGIRKMLHLIWTKANSDEGQGVQIHLVDCYKSLFFTAPDEFSEGDSCTYIARNLISLTYGATAAELTSLEQLLYVMMKNKQLHELVIQKLWQVYGIQQRDISNAQRRGAIIILGMLAAYDSGIVVKELETLFHVGLGVHGKHDFLLARYTCVALQRITSSSQKLPNDHPILQRLVAVMDMYSENREWYALAEQAINAVYSLAKRPDLLCAEVIRRMTRVVFTRREPASPASTRPMSTTCALSQLLFLVGHIAIKQIVHMEAYESEFKRRKAATEKERDEGPPKDEMDLIAGTSEDDFTDAISHIREQELLYDEMALLPRFGKMVAEICSDNLKYNDPQLQISATLCLAKLMCVSSSYCEQNLPLLLTILEKSRDPVTRSNIVIALGDIAVCFNHIIDENTDFLYRRLHDADSIVQRTCLMTLTFLILAGQVKVKGQLGEMAKCLEDDDKSIADMAKMFFTELSRKDNAIYNGYTDIFSTLSADQGLEEDGLRRILKFLSSFIEKEKHAKQLAEKLAARLPRCESEKQWRDVTYALSLLPHKNDEIQKVVTEGFKVVLSRA